jgi:ribosomal protein L22
MTTVNEAMIHKALDALTATIKKERCHPTDILDTVQAQTLKMVDAGEHDTAREFLARIAQRMFIPMSEHFKRQKDHEQAWAYAQLGRQMKQFAESL